MVPYIKGTYGKMKHFPFSVLIILLTYSIKETYGTIEEIEATPTNTNGIELGELSLLQFIFVMLLFLKMVTLYSVGVLPLEIHLGGTLDPFLRTKRALNMSSSTFLLECPLQFVCEVDAWANRDHSADSYMESVLASWIRDPDHTWTHQNGKVYSGVGTCREMYPCPFDVQEVMGITIPGSDNVNLYHEQYSNKDGISYMSFVTEDDGNNNTRGTSDSYYYSYVDVDLGSNSYENN